MLAALPAPQGARSVWLGLSRGQRMALGTIAIAAVVVLLAFVTMTRPSEYQVAFSNLREEDAAAVVTKLKEAKIPYELADRGTIKVPSAQVEEVKLLIAASGVAKQGGGAGFEIFAQPHFGLTEFAEKINFQRALEGELSRSIGRLEAVEGARVHLTLPEQSLFVSQKKDPTAAAVIQLKPGRRLDEAQVQGVLQLIAGSVEGLKTDGVTVMDTSGNVLSRRGDETDPTRKQSDRSGIQRAIEQRITDEVKTMLMPLVGPDKAVVRVNADLDWDQYEANSETFSPSQKAPQVRSRREISESAAQGAATAGGVPGAERNVPGYPAAGSGQSGTAQNEKRDVTTNYELSRTVEKTVRAPGAIRKLNVAVALDSEVIADPAQADAISRLVATAAGLDTNRGDLVTLTSLPFNAAGAVKPADVAEQARQRETMLSLARMIAMVLGPLLVVGMIWLVLRRNRPKSEKPEIKDMSGRSNDPQALKAESHFPALPMPEIDPEQQRIEKELVRMAKNDPSMMANLIRTWMAEDKLGRLEVDMRGKEKAAILLIALGPEVSANVLKQLRENEIEALTMQVFTTENVKEDARKQVLSDCYGMALAQGYLSSGGAAYAGEMLAKALGQDKATEVMARLMSSVRPRHFDFLKDTDPYQLVTFIQDEQPQAIALILSHLPPATAAKILAILQPEQRAEVAMRIATMERTPPEVIEGVEAVLRRRVSTILQSDYSTSGGVEHLAQLLANVDRSTERVILDHLDKNAPELAAEVRKLTFTFENLTQLDDPSLQRVLREVDARDLAMALRGVGEDLRDKIFKNLSSRASEMLREDINVSGPVRMRQVEEAQQRIVGIVRRLEESGDLVIQRGTDDVLV